MTTQSKNFQLCIGGKYPHYPQRSDIYRWDDQRFRTVKFNISSPRTGVLETFHFTTEHDNDPLLSVIPTNALISPTHFLLFRTDRANVTYNPRLPNAKQGYIAHEFREDPSLSRFAVKSFGDGHPRNVLIKINRQTPRAECEFGIDVDIEPKHLTTIESFQCERDTDRSVVTCNVELGSLGSF